MKAQCKFIALCQPKRRARRLSEEAPSECRQLLSAAVPSAPFLNASYLSPAVGSAVQERLDEDAGRQQEGMLHRAFHFVSDEPALNDALFPQAAALSSLWPERNIEPAQLVANRPAILVEWGCRRSINVIVVN